MFPHELSTGLCSLNPQVDRLVQSCLMEVNAKGDVVRYELHDGVIYSDERMTYTAVDAILTQKDSDTRKQYAPLVPLFELMGELFEVLNARRRRRARSISTCPRTSWSSTRPAACRPSLLPSATSPIA